MGVINSASSWMSRSVANDTMLLGLGDSGLFTDDGRDGGVTNSDDGGGAANVLWSSEDTPNVCMSGNSVDQDSNITYRAHQRLPDVAKAKNSEKVSTTGFPTSRAGAWSS